MNKPICKKERSTIKGLQLFSSALLSTPVFVALAIGSFSLSANSAQHENVVASAEYLITDADTNKTSRARAITLAQREAVKQVSKDFHYVTEIDFDEVETNKRIAFPAVVMHSVIDEGKVSCSGKENIGNTCYQVKINAVVDAGLVGTSGDHVGEISAAIGMVDELF